MTPKSRLTRQRQIIIEELQKLHTHPTAYEVYEIVRKKLPKISLGTVYRNLELLSEKGDILKLDTAGTKKRFDGTITEHYHVHCTNCGRIDDLTEFKTGDLVDVAQKMTEFKLTGLRLEFTGLCSKCKTKNS